MDYKKKYENALEWARQVINGECGFIRKDVEEVFSELKESEDEKIRKDVLAFIKREGQHIDKYKWHKWIAWLEKQGEQIELSQSEVTKISGQGWSEECDENLMMIEDRLSDYLDYIREDSSLTKHRKNTLKEEIIGYVNWLKTFKERLS